MNYLEYLIKDYRMLSLDGLLERYKRSDYMSEPNTSTIPTDMKTAIKYVVANKTPAEKRLFKMMVSKYEARYGNN